MSRAGLSEIIPGALYQRSKFLSWPRKQKERVLEEHNIGLVINLWSKVDPEVSGDSRRMYIHWPIHGSEAPPTGQLDLVVNLIIDMMAHGKAVLIHCEAGVNRSCFLTACVVASSQNLWGNDALRTVSEKCGRVKIHDKLRQFVIDHYKL